MQRAGACGRLSVQILDKTYAGADGNPVQAVSGLAFECAPSSCTALVGPSGCGKTTILKIIAGLDPDFQGEVTLNGAATGRARIGFIFQEPTLLPWRSVEENIRFAAPEISATELDRLMKQTAIAEFRTRFPAELSLGLARRVSMVRALASKPDLLLLDEPFVSLDAKTAATLRKLVAEILDREAITALLVTHDLREAVELADRIITLSARPARVQTEQAIPTPRARRSAASLKKLITKIEKTALRV